jgi:hypothetical protein
MWRKASLRIVVLAMLSALLPTLAGATPAFGANADVYRHPVYEGAEAYYGTCPAAGGPAGTSCLDNYLIVYRGWAVDGGGSLARPKATWAVLVLRLRVDFDGTDEPPVTVLAEGDGPPVGRADVDSVHLQTADATFSLPMSDGSTYRFSGTWTARAPRQVYGNDGPAGGLTTHFNDRCLVQNAHAHQKFGFSTMTGTADGVPVRSYGDFDFAATVFHNDFTYITVPHQGCA